MRQILRWFGPKAQVSVDDILDGLTRRTQLGYPSVGRRKGLAEPCGIMTPLTHPLGGAVA